MNIHPVLYKKITIHEASILQDKYKEAQVLENKTKSIFEISIYPQMGKTELVSKWLENNNYIDNEETIAMNLGRFHKIVFSILQP